MTINNTFLRRFLFFVLFVSCLNSGCAKTIPAPPHESRSSAGGGTPLFTPLEEHAALVLSPAESVALARRLSSARQGLPSWKEMDAAVSRSLSYVSSRPSNGIALSFPGLSVTWGNLAAGLTTLRNLLPRLDNHPELLASSFRWLRLGPDFSFTGYYEPTLKASRAPTKTLTAPLYRKPDDLQNNLPYLTRNAIDRHNALRGKKLEIAYVDETDAYFLHVQGSGRLQFSDGSIAHVLYAGKNNRAYVSLGRIMKERGLLPEGGVNMRAIRGYLAQHPQERAELFDENPSYVFFRTLNSPPIGSMGSPLTPWVSLAVDRNIVPQGSVTFIITSLPNQDANTSRAFSALTLPQDSGGAIKGHRMDIYCGAGGEAEHVAGHLDAKGAVYILLPAQ
ncbi:transglycosylase [Deltaproteobacteria bacterium]|nr:transglycosylase [Deltaproteobacteria bacterium]